ncbi:hypothetical protein GA0115255_113614 [Streptomyces sp. Ncost-T6T-2b]|nr:hypothetical protein GA0115255_113614 [Streptomyces sp. Ncost-T6T-2b]
MCVAAQRVLEQPFGLDEEVLVDGARQVGVAGQQVGEGFPAPGGEPGGRDLRADEPDVLPGGAGVSSSYVVTGRRVT